MKTNAMSFTKMNIVWAVLMVSAVGIVADAAAVPENNLSQTSLTTHIGIGQTDSKITDRGGCNFWKSNVKAPKLVKKMFDGGRDGFIEYEHESGRPILLEGQEGSDENYQRISAIKINGKEILLKLTKAERNECLDETYKEHKPCEKREYANQDVRVMVEPLTNQSVCFPDTAECAGNSISALVTIQNVSEKTTLVVVGNCGG